ncbi:MAG: type II toxin-antitoxin system VapC family toxin [Gaiella sp.]|nr:type II toxin-antitoxin system VapC family toxin [Gaiella sp.]
MTLVVDASAVVAALVDGGEDGEWAEALLESDSLAAPHLMPAEVANILRRASLAREITEDVAVLAYGDLLELRVELFPYEPFAARVWELRRNVTACDAWYVALAEELGARLATLDERLASAAGPHCRFVTQPD